MGSKIDNLPFCRNLFDQLSGSTLAPSCFKTKHEREMVAKGNSGSKLAGEELKQKMCCNEQHILAKCCSMLWMH